MWHSTSKAPGKLRLVAQDGYTPVDLELGQTLVLNGYTSYVADSATGEFICRANRQGRSVDKDGLEERRKNKKTKSSVSLKVQLQEHEASRQIKSIQKNRPCIDVSDAHEEFDSWEDLIDDLPVTEFPVVCENLVNSDSEVVDTHYSTVDVRSLPLLGSDKEGTLPICVKLVDELKEQAIDVSPLSIDYDDPVDVAKGRQSERCFWNTACVIAVAVPRGRVMEFKHFQDLFGEEEAKPGPTYCVSFLTASVYIPSLVTCTGMTHKFQYARRVTLTQFHLEYWVFVYEADFRLSFHGS